MQEVHTLSDLVRGIYAKPRETYRRVIALAGPPASGKSSLAEELRKYLVARGESSMVVPMDGFHLPNQELAEMGALDRKGAPHTFDVDGLLGLAKDLQSYSPVDFPIFNREKDVVIYGAGHLPLECRTVIIEGNYLLYNAPVWRELSRYWSASVYLDVRQDVLRQRLVQRWMSYGADLAHAENRAESNDLQNALLVADHLLEPDFTYRAKDEEI